MQIQSRPDMKGEPLPKRRKIEESSLLEDYPSEMIVQFIYHAIKKENENVCSDTLVGDDGEELHNPFHMSSFDSCSLVSKEWNRCAETAAIHFANFRADGHGFNFLKFICHRVTEDEVLFNNKRMKDLINRRGHEIYTFVDCYIWGIGGTIKDELQYMPNLQTICLYEDHADEIENLFTLCPKITALRTSDPSEKLLKSISLKLPFIQHLDLECCCKIINMVDCLLDYESMAEIAKLANLETLFIEFEGLEKPRVEHVEKLLTLFDDGFHGLKSLTLHSSSSTCDLNAAIFSPHPKLETLRLSSLIKFDFPNAIESLPNLKRIKDENLQDSDLLKIGGYFPKLEHLDLSGSQVSDCGLTGFVCQRTSEIEVDIQQTKTSVAWCRQLQQTFPHVKLHLIS